MLSNFDFKTFYSTFSDDIPRNFYNLALQESIAYDRVSGYFSSASLSYYANGIENLLKNNGKFRLIISHDISKEDYDEIVHGYENREEILSKALVSKINWNELSISQKYNISNLGYLIEIGLVDIKIGFTHSGLFHAKFGIFRDNFENIIYFSGSLNETEAAFKKNYEEITVLNNWTSDNFELRTKANYFEKLWNNQQADGRIFIKSIDEVVKSKLVSYSQGKVIVEQSIFEENVIVLYFDKTLCIKNNLNKQIDIKQRSMKQLIRKGYCDDNFNSFNPNLSYVEIEEIIKFFKRYEERKGEKVVISDSVYKYIKDSKFEIESVAKRGLSIKNKDEIFKPNLEEFIDIVNTEVSRRLYNIQSWVSFYQAVMRRGANFSVPGSGKTSMIYGTYAYLSSPRINKVDRVVVIGPKNSFISWKEEFKNVFGKKRKLSVLDIHDEIFRDEMFYKNIDKYNLFLINYEALEKYEIALNNVINSRTMIVFDEVHKIKRVESKRSKIAINLAKKTNYRYVLTGTPIPNSYQDIWNFLHILYDIEFDKYFDISLPQLNNPDIISINEINDKLSPFFWRVTKSELQVPPANDDKIISIEANDTEQEIIDLLWRKFSHNPFKLYIRLIQLSSNPQLLKEKITVEMYGNYDIEEEELDYEILDEAPVYEEDDLKLIDSLNISSKFISCLELADELINESKIIVIWCIFVDTIKKLNRYLYEKGYRVAVIYGGISSKEREDIILAFQSGKYDVLITNPHTLAESVSLHMVSHDAIYLEYSFNLTHMLQSRDRIHRLGLECNQETNYYYFVLDGKPNSRSTIDRKIYTRLAEKRDRMYEAIESPILQPEYSLNEKDAILELMEEELR